MLSNEFKVCLFFVFNFDETANSAENNSIDTVVATTDNFKQKWGAHAKSLQWTHRKILQECKLTIQIMTLGVTAYIKSQSRHTAA